MDYNPISPAIRDVLTAIRHRKRVDEIVELILDRACQLAHAVHGSFITVDVPTRKLIITSTHGPDWTLEKQACQLKLGEGITGRVASTGIPYLCGDVTRDPNYFPLFDYVRSELAVPVIVGDQVWGIINFDGLSVSAFNEHTLSTLTVFAELASFAITLRLELNEQERLQRHLVQSEKLASLGEIIAGIAHEINNPLTAILGHASLLTMRRGGEADDASIEAILHESRRTADLVKSLLSFSRKEVGEKEIIGINEIIEQACSIKRYHLRVSNIQLVTELDRISYPVLVSRQQIQQVLLNLINNAEQAIPPQRRDGVVKIKVTRQGQILRLSIEDNGAGIPTDAQKFIFDPFFTTKELGEGTGLGLSIAHSIIEAHGGNLAVSSTGPQGTIFHIDLPLATSPETPRPSPRNDPASDGNALMGPAEGTVLLVDDEPQIIRSLTEFLEIQSVEVFSASDVPAARALLKQHRFDVIISDIRMPGEDGLALYEHARSIDKTYANRFIFMSGDLVRESTESFVKTTSCICLEKPFSLETFYRHIRGFFRVDGETEKTVASPEETKKETEAGAPS